MRNETEPKVALIKGVMCTQTLAPRYIGSDGGCGVCLQQPAQLYAQWGLRIGVGVIRRREERVFTNLESNSQTFTMDTTRIYPPIPRIYDQSSSKPRKVL